jgi:hypothetical protein
MENNMIHRRIMKVIKEIAATGQATNKGEAERYNLYSVIWYSKASGAAAGGYMYKKFPQGWTELE